MKEYSHARDFRTCTGSISDDMYIGAKNVAREIHKLEVVWMVTLGHRN